MRVVQDGQGRGAADVGPGDRGQRDPDRGGAERVLGDALGPLDAQQLPSRARLVLELAHLEQEGGSAGERMLAIFGTGQAGLLPDVDAAADQTAHVAFVAQGADRGLDCHASPEGKLLRKSAFRNRVWVPAITATGLTDVHFHDLRHAGNNLVAEVGATLRELMDRMGHSSSRAALIYLHSSTDRQRALADAIAARTLNDLGGGR